MRLSAGAGVDRPAECVGSLQQACFQFLLAADEMPEFSDLAALVKSAGRTAKCNIPVQGQFF
jgi:hypothetical protein